MRIALEMLNGIGVVTSNVMEALRYIWQGRISVKHTMQQATIVGADSVPIALIIGSIAGCVLSLHAAERFAQTGAHAYVGGLVALAMVREMGPIFTAMAVGARAGTAISAEIANMSVTNQLDALQMMHVSPVRYLLVPRLLAAVFALPLVTILTVAVGIIGGLITATATAGIHYSIYLDSVWLNVKPYDLEVCLIKATIFGVLLAGISVTCGLVTRGGAKNVGLATTAATVWTAIAVLISDFFLTWIFFGTTLSD